MQSVRASNTSKGVTKKCLLDIKLLVEKENAAYTTAEVAKNIIEPLTRDHDTSFVGLLEQKANISGGRSQNDFKFQRSFPDEASDYMNQYRKADVRVVHCWNDRFIDTVDAILNTFNTDTDNWITFWVDMLSNNLTRQLQVGRSGEDREAGENISTAGLMISEIGHTAVVALPFANPGFLSRTWCLWEILSSLRMNARLTVTTLKTKGKTLEGTILKSFRDTETKWVQVSFASSASYHLNDKTKIIERLGKRLGDVQNAEELLVKGLRSALHDTAVDRIGYIEGTMIKNNDYNIVIDKRGKVYRDFFHLGKKHFKSKHYDEAEQYFRKALSNREKYLGRDHVETLNVLHYLGNVLSGMGKIDEAEEVYWEVAAGRELALGPDHPNTLCTINNLAVLLKKHGKLHECADMYQRTLMSRERVLGPNHPLTLNMVNHLATIHNEMGDLEEAEKLYKRALKGREESGGANDKYTISTLNNLGLLLHSRGKFGEAEAVYKRALEGNIRELGDEHPFTLTCMHNIGYVLKKQKKFVESEGFQSRALEGRKKVLGADHPQVASVKKALASVRRAQKAQLSPGPDEDSSLSARLPTEKRKRKSFEETLNDLSADTAYGLWKTEFQASPNASVDGRQKGSQNQAPSEASEASFSPRLPTIAATGEEKSLASVPPLQGTNSPAMHSADPSAAKTVHGRDSDRMSKYLRESNRESIKQTIVDTARVLDHNQGVRLCVLQIIRDYTFKINPALTTGEVCEHFIKPLTKHEKSSFLDLLFHKNDLVSAGRDALGTSSLDDLGQYGKDRDGWTPQGLGSLFPLDTLEYVGSKDHADVYVCHAWSAPFADFVDALESQYNNDRHENTTFWIDLVCVNQWKHSNLGTGIKNRTKLSPSDVLAVIDKIGSCAFVVMPWREPVALTRVWPLFELHCALEARRKVNIITNGAGRKDLHDNILNELKPTIARLANVDITVCKSTLYEDKREILSLLRELYGDGDKSGKVTSVNSRLRKCFEDWFNSNATRSINDLEIETLKQEKAANSARDIADASDCYAEAKRLFKKGDLDYSAERFEQALNNRTRYLGRDHLETLAVLHKMANLMNARGDVEEAEDIYREVVTTRTKLLGANHPETLGVVNNFAIILKNQGKLEEAEDMYLRALQGREETLGPDHTDTLSSVNNLAVLYNTMGRLDEAEEMYRRALEGRERVLGPNHPQTLGTANNLAVLVNARGDYATAETLYRRAIAGNEESLGADHLHTLTNVYNLGNVLRSQRKYDEAEACYKRAFAGREKAVGRNHQVTRKSLETLIDLLMEQGKHDEAEALREKYGVSDSPSEGDASLKDAEDKDNLPAVLVPSSVLIESAATGQNTAGAESKNTNAGIMSEQSDRAEQPQSSSQSSAPPIIVMASRKSSTKSSKVIDSSDAEAASQQKEQKIAEIDDKVVAPMRELSKMIQDMNDAKSEARSSEIKEEGKVDDVDQAESKQVDENTNANIGKVESLDVAESAASPTAAEEATANEPKPELVSQLESKPKQAPGPGPEPEPKPEPESEPRAAPGREEEQKPKEEPKQEQAQPPIPVPVPVAAEESAMKEPKNDNEVSETESKPEKESVPETAQPLMPAAVLAEESAIREVTKTTTVESAPPAAEEKEAMASEVKASAEDSNSLLSSQIVAPTEAEAAPAAEESSKRLVHHIKHVESAPLVHVHDDYTIGKIETPGVKLACLTSLKNFVLQVDKSMTTQDVYDKIVQPYATFENDNFVNILRKYQTIKRFPVMKDQNLVRRFHNECSITYKEGGCDAASLYVSHSRAYNFVQFVECLESHFNHDVDSESVGLYVDILCWNHTSGLLAENAVGQYPLRDMIGSVKHTFAVLLPWAKSALYADKWCLFELYLSSIHECRLTVAIPQADAEKIDDQMLGPKARELGEEFAAVDFGGAKLTPPSLAVDLGSAAAIDALAVKTLKSNENKVENEKKGISDAVMYKRVNIEIIDSLKRWLDQRIEQVIDEALDLLEELVHDANKSFAEGRMEEAEGLFQRSYDGCSILLGPEHEDTLAVQHEFGVICKKANNLQKAEDMLQAAVTGREKAIGKDNLETINSVMMLAEVKHLRGSLQESEALYERAMKSVAKEFGEKHELYLACLQAIAALHVERGRADEAEASLRRVMEALHAAHGPDHPDTLAATHALAVFYSERDMNDAAEPLYKTAYEGRARTLGEADAGTLVSMSALAETYRKLGRTAEAEDVYRRLIPLSERAFGSTHADTLSSCNNLASILSDRGEIVDAERFYRQAYDGRLKTIGPEHPRTLGTMNNLAVLLINTKDPAKKQEGEKLLLEVLERREKALGMSNRDTCATATYLAGHFKDTQRYAAAEALYRDVVDGRIEDVGLYNSQTLHAVTNLALMLTVMDKLKEADEEYARALDIHDRLNAKDDPGRLKVMSNYGALLVHKKDYEKAEVIYKEVVTQREQSLGPDDQQTLKSVYVLGTVYKANGKPELAEECLQRVRGAGSPMLKGGSAYISVKGGGVSTPRSEAVMNSRAISSMLQLAATTAAAGKLEETETHYNQALQLCIDTPSIGKEHKLAVHAYVGLAHVALRRGFLDQSEDNYTNALRSAEKTLGASDPQTITILGDLAMTQRRRGRLLDAERLLRQAIERHNSISNPTQQNELIKLNYTCNLADVLREKGELAEAEKLYLQVHEARSGILGDKHADTLSALENVAFLLQTQEKAESAMLTFRKVYQGRKEQLGQGDIGTLDAQEGYAQSLAIAGEVTAAEKEYTKLLKLLDKKKSRMEKAGQDEDADKQMLRLSVYNQLAVVKFKLLTSMEPTPLTALTPPPPTTSPRPPLAQQLSASAIASGDTSRNETPRSPKPPPLQKQTSSLGKHDITMSSPKARFEGQYAEYCQEIEELFRRSLVGREVALGEAHSDVLDCVENFAGFLAYTERLNQAIQQYKRLVITVEKRSGVSDLYAQVCLRALVACYERVGNVQTANALEGKLMPHESREVTVPLLDFERDQLRAKSFT